MIRPGSEGKLVVKNCVPQSLLIVTCLLSQSVLAQQCRQAKFKGHLASGEGFTQTIGAGLELRLEPVPNDGGWDASVSPHGSDDDWAYIVNPPFHFGNSQCMSSEYGETVRERLSHPHEINFVLTASDYDRMLTLAKDALWPYNSKNPEHAPSNYEKALAKVPKGLLVVQPIDYDRQGPSDQASWMDFEVVVIVPDSFAGNPTLKWASASCTTPPQ